MLDFFVLHVDEIVFSYQAEFERSLSICAFRDAIILKGELFKCNKLVLEDQRTVLKTSMHFSISMMMVFASQTETQSHVAWMHFEQSAILTVHNHVITRNPRISVTHDKHDKHRTWFLHINNVQEEDRGRYMCQINTVTAKTQYGFVKVVDSLKSIDLSRRQNSYAEEEKSSYEALVILLKIFVTLANGIN
uniref:Ig domain-containing protein n=1 Tax=Glossina austeni TaxID=7395 RepID=A0A1A9V7E6_GLOAU